MIKVGIIGSSGYTGNSCGFWPATQADVTYLASHTYAGSPVGDILPALSTLGVCTGRHR